jgi:hypothetical protein
MNISLQRALNNNIQLLWLSIECSKRGLHMTKRAYRIKKKRKEKKTTLASKEKLNSRDGEMLMGKP